MLPRYIPFVALILLSHLFRLRISPHLLSPHALWSSLFFFSSFFSFPFPCTLPLLDLSTPSTPRQPPPPPLPGADWAVFSSLNQWACCCRVILYKPTPRSWDTVRDAVRFAATVRPTSMRLKKILCGLCSVQGGFPISLPPPFYWILLRNANLLASSPVNNCSMAPSFETHAVLLDLYVIWLDGDVHHTKVHRAFNTPGNMNGWISDLLTAHAAGVSEMFSN